MARLHNVLSNSSLPVKITLLGAWNRDVGYLNLVPNIASMHAFSYVGYAYTPKQKRVKGNKFAPRAVKGYLVGIVGDYIYQM